MIEPLRLDIANKMEADMNGSLQWVVEDFSPPDSPPLPSHEEFLIEEPDDENKDEQRNFPEEITPYLLEPPANQDDEAADEKPCTQTQTRHYSSSEMQEFKPAGTRTRLFRDRMWGAQPKLHLYLLAVSDNPEQCFFQTNR